MLRSLIFSCLFLLSTALLAQVDFYKDYDFNYGDTLRGSLRAERTCFDVLHYNLDIQLNPKKKYIKGQVGIRYAVVEDFSTLQLDLYQNMAIDRILWQGKELKYRRLYDAVFITFPETQLQGKQDSIQVYYQGTPTEAKNPPWDGGVVWSKDKQGRPWFAVACEGDGASLWWPNKDHLSDEPDSMLISLTVPEELMAVANGSLRQVVEKEDYTRYEWAVTYPIDNYNVTFNVGHYVHFADEYKAFDEAPLALDYYVLDYNEEKAQKHFKQTHEVLAAYEHFMGKYPFWNDGFAMVETPYLGMEHQGAIAYGNRYMRGYLGGLIPLDMHWDYIIVHETGHEYYGNSIGCSDMAEMWIQESFTTYLEALFVEYIKNKADAYRYLQTQRSFILNQEPILGPKGVNFENWVGSDHYYKGAWVLHSLRNAINDDELWFKLFRQFYQENQLSLVNTQDVIDFYNKHTSKDWSAFFEQYLTYPTLPVLEYQIKEKKDEIIISYRWQADVAAFDMPIVIRVGDQYESSIEPNTQKWQKLSIIDAKADDVSFATDLFLIKTQRLTQK